MSAISASSQDPSAAPRSPGLLQRIAGVRALFALVWAVALFAAAGSHKTSTSVALMAATAALLASYPLIDVTASIVTSRSDATARNLMSVNAIISTAAVIALAVTGFGFSAGTALASFGLWAAVSGLIQLYVALRRRRTSGGQLPMIISGALSTIAGIMFVARAGGSNVQVTTVAGYMALGAVLYLVWAARERAHTHRTN